MARIKYGINEDSTLVKLECLQYGEVFLCDGIPCIKTSGIVNVLDLSCGKWSTIPDDTLVTYVKSAELKLTI